MAQWLKDIGITDYDFNGVYPYSQYRDIAAVSDFCKYLNQYISEGLNTFFKSFATNINLRDENIGGYSFFYLMNYFGMFSGSLDLGTYVSNFYDSGYIKYESADESGKLYRYDDVSVDPIGEVSTFTGFYPVLATIASWSLDRKWEVINIPAVADLLVRVYKTFTDDELDLNTIKFEDNGNIVVTLPNTALWRFISRLSIYDILFFNLPFDKSVRFNIAG